MINVNKGFMLSRGNRAYKGYRDIININSLTNYNYSISLYSPPRDFFKCDFINKGFIVLMKNKTSYIPLININRLLCISRGVFLR